MMKSILTRALATAALIALATGAQAKETVVWWDFLSGGDGVRMKSLIDQFNKELKAAGLLGDDGLPKGLDGVDNFHAALEKLKEGGSEYGVSIHSAASDSAW